MQTPNGDSGNPSASGAGRGGAAAAVLAGYQLFDPCQRSYKAGATPGDVCPKDTPVKNQAVSLQFGGDSELIYNVTLRVRGITEGYWYTGGQFDSKSKTFHTGGLPTIGGFSSACENKTSGLPFMPARGDRTG